MCEPISIGIATAALGSLQSIAGYQQQQAQYQYQQQAAQYQYQIEQRNAEVKYNQEMAAFEASQRAYEAQLTAEAAAANRGYVYEQLKLQGETDKARQEARDLMIAKLKAQGEVLSKGRTGGATALMVSDAEREYGRDLAALGRNLGYAGESYLLSTAQIESQARSGYAAAAGARMTRPIKGLVAAPMVGPAPSAAGMVLGIGQSILGGVTTGMSLAAPAGGAGKAASKGTQEAGKGLKDLSSSMKTYSFDF